MEEINTNLNYFKDSDGNYIIRRVYNGEENASYITCSGSFNSNFLFSKKDFKKKLEELFEKTATQIEESTFKKYKVKKEDIIFEKIVGNFIDEKEYNPMFSKMAEKEIIKFCGNSIKAKITITFEFHIKPKNSLKIRSFIGFLFNKTVS